MCGLRERGLNQKKTKTKHPKELKHFQLRTVRPEQDPRGAEQSSETPHEQPRGKKKGFIHRSCLPFDLYWSCKQSVHGEKPGEQACPNASIPVEVTIWGIASLFAAKPPGKSKNTKTKQRHDISCEGWCQGEEPPGPEQRLMELSSFTLNRPHVHTNMQENCWSWN